MMDYITKKIPRRLVPAISRLKAKFEIENSRRFTEGEIIALALAKLEEDSERKFRIGILGLAGIVTGGKKSKPSDIDAVLYGA